MDVAIIGAGAAGLSIALTLHSRNIKCTIYEAKESPFRGVGALMLAPNALRILDTLGLYSQLKSKGFNFSKIQFRDENDNLNDTCQLGNKDKYGYDALRVTRPDFLDVLRAAVAERGIQVKYATRYSHIIEETAAGVTFQLSNGSQIKADILVGADGVYSHVRKCIAPQVEPIYSGTLALIATVQHRFTETAGKPQTTFFHGDSSALLAMPQENDGSKLCLGTQRKYPEQSREDWVHLTYDKDRLYSLFMENSHKWPQRVQTALSKLDKNDIYIWPFQALPDLSSWTTLPHRRVVLVGDAAHSIPPTGGQGACQAIEDAYTLAMVISNISKIPNLSPDSYARSISTWQTARLERVQKARLFTRQLDNNRIPPSERASKLQPGTYWEENQKPDLTWLFGTGAAASAAKGPPRVEVKKTNNPPAPRRGTFSHSRGKSLDSAFGNPTHLMRKRAGTTEIVKGAC